MSATLEHLKSIEQLQALGEDDLKKIETVSREENYADGEVIIAEGAMSDTFFILIGGTVQIWKKFQQPEQELLTVYSQGRMFGELALIEDMPRSATVAAKGDVRLLAVDREDFHRLITQCQGFALMIMRSISATIRERTESFIERLKSRNWYLGKVYEQMKGEMEERRRVEEALRRHRDELEEKVQSRTRALDNVNQALRLQIDSHKQAEAEKERLIADLQDALRKVTALGGLLPVCVVCKKVRDDQGYWKQLETYVQEHSGAEIQHSICAACSEKRFPEFYKA
jgi:CRP-like cAMP-binding protein